MRESEIQSYWREQFETIGGICRKVKAEVVNGLPDFLNAFRSRVFFIEFKATGETSKPHQVLEQNRWKDEGVAVFEIDSIEKCNVLLMLLLKNKPFPCEAFRPR